MNTVIEAKQDGADREYSKASIPKIVHIIAINGIGGAERHLVDLLPALQKEGNYIECLILFQDGSIDHAKSIGRQLEDQGIPVSYHRYAGVFDRSVFGAIEGFVLTRTPHLIHTHLKHAEFWLAFLKWRRRLQVPVISTIHGYRDAYHSKHGLAWRPANRLSTYYWLSRFVGRQLDAFISISRGVTGFFTKGGLIGEGKIRTIHHGTPVNDLRTGFGQGPSPNLVVIGRLVRFKGHAYAIEAVRHLKPRYPTISLHFYGTGPEEQSLRKQVAAADLKENVFFHGFVKDIPNAISGHSIAVLPSIGEPFGLVFFDAFKAGLPVVAFDVSAVNEIIVHAESGLLAEPLNAKDLAAQVEVLIQDRQLYQKLADRARERLRKEFSIERMAEEYTAFYHEIIFEKAVSFGLNF